MSTINVDEDIAELDAAREQDKQAAALKAFGGGTGGGGGRDGGGPSKGGLAPEGGITHWLRNLPKNVGVGLLDAALNTLEAVQPENPDAAAGESDQGTFTAGMYTPPLTPSDRRNGQLMEGDHGEVVKAAMGFRNELAKGGDRTSDAVTQGVSQFLIPFMGWSKAMRVGQAANTVGNIVRAGAAEAGTMATAFDPHSGRMADLVELGKHTEGKLADALNTLAPDDSAINAYIEYMTDRENESEAEGRFKNVIDSLGASAAIGTVLKVGAKAFKGTKAFAESPVTLPEIGAPEHLVQQHVDEALKQFPDPRVAMVHLTEHADNILDDAEHATIKAARDKVAAGAPEQGITIVPTQEGHTVVVGKQPYMTFLDEKDAVAAAQDVQRLLGANFERRAAAEHAKATDANFATLHAFSRVLKSNVDRPVSTHSLLSALERNIKGDTEQGAFYKELLGRLVRKKVSGQTTVSSKAGKHDNSAGHYAYAMQAIDLYEKAFRDPKTLLHTFTHEAVHAATVHEMNASARLTAQMERLRKTTQDIFEKESDELEAANGGRRGRPYGFTNAAEFVAEIEANPEFRKQMQKTKLPEGGTAWDKYLETIAGILGISALVATPTGQKEFNKLMTGPKQDDNGA